MPNEERRTGSVPRERSIHNTGFPEGHLGLTTWRYINCDGPTSVAAASTFALALTLKNCGWRPWDSDKAAAAVTIAAITGFSRIAPSSATGRRTSLPKAVAPGESLTLTVNVDAPGQAGRYISVG